MTGGNALTAGDEARSGAASGPDGLGIEELIRPELRGRSPYGAPQLDVAVALNTNESSYPVPQPVVEAIHAALGEDLRGLNRYPDREFIALRKALGEYLRDQSGVTLPVEMLWAGNGSNEVLQHLVQVFGGTGRTALGFTPAYSMHPIICETLGTTWVDGNRAAGTFDLEVADAVATASRVDPDLVFLCSPNNPTGTALPFEAIEALLDAAPRAVVVVDEAYAEFARPGTPSALQLLERHPRLVVTRTMSKAFTLAGGRLGYLAADPAIIDALRLVRLPYHLSTPTQTIARVALEQAPHLLGTVEAIKAQRDRLVEDLTALGLTPIPSDANFVLFGGLADAGATWQALLEDGVLVRDVGIPHHLRVTAGTPEETSRFLQVITELAPTHRLDPVSKEPS